MVVNFNSVISLKVNRYITTRIETILIYDESVLLNRMTAALPRAIQPTKTSLILESGWTSKNLFPGQNGFSVLSRRVIFLKGFQLPHWMYTGFLRDQWPLPWTSKLHFQFGVVKFSAQDTREFRFEFGKQILLPAPYLEKIPPDSL